MKNLFNIIFCCLLISCLVAGGYIYFLIKTPSFEVTTNQISKDLDGKSINLLYNQVWIFDKNQKINVEIVSKRQSDEVIFLVAKLKSSVKIQDKNLSLNGLVKITYEYIEDWHLMNVENISAKLIGQ